MIKASCQRPTANCLPFCLLAFLIIISCGRQAALAGSPLGQDSASAARTLLVDDSITFQHPDGASYFTEALDAGGFDYDVFVVSEAATLPSISVLSCYDSVIWTSGYNSNPFVGETAKRVSQYLDGGGAMLVSSEYFARDNSDSMRDHFHIEFQSRPTVGLLDGEPDDPITSGMELILESLVSADGSERACVVTPTDVCVSPILRADSMSEPNILAVRVPSDNVSLPYRIVLTCFPFESILGLDYAPDIRARFMANALNWLVDEFAPEIRWASPAPGASILHPNSAICVELSDLGTGIDPESVWLLVDGRAVEPELRKLQDCTSLLYGTPDGFTPGSQIQVELFCQDRYRTPNRMEPCYSSFSVEQNAQFDTEPPYPMDYGPTGSIPVASEGFEIYALIADDGTGVDRASLSLTIDDRRLSAETKRIDGACMISCAFPRDMAFGKDYDVAVSAQDLSFPANTMEPFVFRFTLEDDVYPPYVLLVSPPEGALLDLDEFRQEPYGNRIHAWLRDSNGDVDVSSIQMRVNGGLASFSSRSILNGLEVTHTLGQGEIGYNQQVFVELSASDVSLPPNQMEPFSWTFSFGDDRNPPAVQATIPGDGSRRVPRNTYLFFMVSEEVDPGSVTSDLITATTASVESGQTVPINGQVGLNSDVPYIWFAPYQSLPSGATISVQMNASLLDMAGNRMAEPYQFQFTTSGDFDLEPPPAPTALDGSVGNGLIRITWRGSSAASFYRVYYDSDGCCEPYEGTDAKEGASPITVRASGSTFLLSGLDNDKTYHVTVTAMDRCANESDYCDDEFVGSPERVPSAPVITDVQAGNSSAYIEWEPINNISVDGYRVYYRMTSGAGRASAEGLEANAVDVGQSSNYRFSGLIDEADYEMWVVTYDDFGDEGIPSEVVTVRPSFNVDWLELQLPGPVPSRRSRHQLVLDPIREKVFILGGYGAEEGVLNALDLKSFQWEIIPTTGPFPPAGRCFAFYDEDRDVVWMAASNRSIYRLSLSDYQWLAFGPSGEPPPASNGEPPPTLPSAGFLDARRNRLLFYGCFMANYERVLNFYSFDLDSHEWQTLECSGDCPTEVSWSAFTYVPSLDRGYLFGGLAQDDWSSKLYMMDPESLHFLRLPPSGDMPTQRVLHSMALDEDLNRLIVFAGEAVSSKIGHRIEVNFLHAYDLDTNQWSDLTHIVTGMPPSPRVDAPLVTIPRGTIDQNAYMLTFGGGYENAPAIFDDLHCLRLYDYTGDTTPPARVDDLGADLDADKTKVRLHWTAPGDDGMLGRAQGYDVRFTTAPILNDEDFTGALRVPILYLPSFPGATENLLLPLPQSGVTYYFALKTYDDAKNYSELSNCASTSAAPQASWAFRSVVRDGLATDAGQNNDTAACWEVSK
ncbi:MAG: Ig-like domain-containing protein [Candidatus Coatesbacteria bacterium]|nr:Ig-like domain-containing protein [Candidatus Coatesbacteria bacterium]